MENRDIIDPNNDELSLKEIIQKIIGLVTFFKLQFWKLLIFSIIGGGIGFWLAYSSTPIYSARTKFLMKESGGGSSLMSSLGSLGSLIGGAGGTVSPLDRTLAIMGSEKIVGDALFKKILVEGKLDLAINHLIEIQELRKLWEKDTVLNGVQFLQNRTTKESLNFKQRKAYKIVINLLIGEKATIIGKIFDKKSGVFDLTVNTKNEDFSIEFNKVLYNELEMFMYNQSTNSSGKNIEIIASKLDSIKTELNGVQNALARHTDRTLGLLMQEDKVDQKNLMMKEQMLTIMYGEAQKNLETFKFVNESINKALEVIQTPFSPIQPSRKSKVKFTLIGFLASGILGFGLLFIIKWTREQL